MELVWLIASLILICYAAPTRRPWRLFALIGAVPFFCTVLIGVLSDFLDQAQGGWEVLDLVAIVLVALMFAGSIYSGALMCQPANRRQGPRGK